MHQNLFHNVICHDFLASDVCWILILSVGSLLAIVAHHHSCIFHSKCSSRVQSLFSLQTDVDCWHCSAKKPSKQGCLHVQIRRLLSHTLFLFIAQKDRSQQELFCDVSTSKFYWKFVEIKIIEAFTHWHRVKHAKTRKTNLSESNNIQVDSSSTYTRVLGHYDIQYYCTYLANAMIGYAVI